MVWLPVAVAAIAKDCHGLGFALPSTSWRFNQPNRQTTVASNAFITIWSSGELAFGSEASANLDPTTTTVVVCRPFLHCA